MHYRNLLGFFMLPAMMAVVTIAAGAPREPTEDRVPPSAMKEALSYKAPFGETRTAPPEIVAAGKALYEGKGSCFLCHGISGKGDGPAAHMNQPSAKRFHELRLSERARRRGTVLDYQIRQSRHGDATTHPRVAVGRGRVEGRGLCPNILRRTVVASRCLAQALRGEQDPWHHQCAGACGRERKGHNHEHSRDTRRSLVVCLLVLIGLFSYEISFLVPEAQCHSRVCTEIRSAVQRLPRARISEAQ